jgi:uncharacterized protein (TIGR00251 family)
MSAAFIRELAGGVGLAVCVQPRASRTEIGALVGNELKIHVAAPPVDDAANEALVRFLAKGLACGRGRIQVVRGARSRHKVVAIAGITAAEVVRRLAGLLHTP